VLYPQAGLYQFVWKILRNQLTFRQLQLHNETLAMFTVHFGWYMMSICRYRKWLILPFQKIDLAKLLWGDLRASPHNFLAVGAITPMESAPMHVDSGGGVQVNPSRLCDSFARRSQKHSKQNPIKLALFDGVVCEWLDYRPVISYCLTLSRQHYRIDLFWSTVHCSLY